MIINNNIPALNTYRMMNSAANGTSASMEKLSSGQRINKASDDAAGLAISEKMRGQIRGLEMAQKNSQDGVSLLQTAEGALNETHSILQRMRELSVQAANDTNTTSDREKLQGEVDALAEEVARIGSSTEFNGKNLLDGSFDGTFQIGANKNQNMSIKLGDAQSFSLGLAGDAKIAVSGTYTAGNTAAGDTLKDGNYNVVETGASAWEIQDDAGTTIASSTDGKTYTMKTFDGSAGDDVLAFGQAVTSGTVTVDGGAISAKAAFENGGLQAGTYTFDTAQKALLDKDGNIAAISTDSIEFSNENGEVVFTASAALTATDKVTVGGVNISTQDAANDAISTINKAIETVSAERSKMGAVQNRLQFTTNSLSTTAENLTAAESRIRDVDMAKEMMSFTKNNILSQAAQSMLAQANQQPQAVLQLLR